MTDGKSRRPIFFRNLNGGQLVENFLISAVVALLAVRFYLRLTGFPQLGGRGLHIAHMLWGGLLMLVAIFMLLAYLGHRVRQAAAVVGGIGFGLFIDELGKFITSDNNYFYRPAIALIYAVFVLLFIWWRAFGRRWTATEETYLANSLMLMQDAALHELDPREKYRLLNWLRQSGETGRSLLGDPERSILSRPADVVQPNPVARRLRPVFKRIRAAVRSRWAARIAITVIVLRTAAAGIVSVALLVAPETTGPGESIDLPLLISGGVSGILALIGLIYLLRNKPGAIRWFRRSVLASILLTDLFTFYYQQLEALGYLALDLVLLAVLDALLLAEERNPRPTLPREAQAA